MLTTDGIHEYVSVDELEDFMSGELSETTMQLLADKAKRNGSSDDQTIIVIDRMWEYGIKISKECNAL